MTFIEDLGYTEQPGRNRRFGIFRCDCGSEITARIYSNFTTDTKSCLPCSYKNRFKNRYKKRWGKHEQLRNSWRGMIGRCKDKSLAYYGAKGITVCKEWEDFDTFKAWALDNGYKPKLTIDRINSDGNYEPSNCRWLTHSENSGRSGTRENGGKGVKVSIDDASEICEAYATGLFTYPELAKAFSVSRAIVYNICISAGIVKPLQPKTGLRTYKRLKGMGQ